MFNVSCARAIADTSRGRGLAQRAAVIAVTTAITESTLHNYTEAADHDSTCRGGQAFQLLQRIAADPRPFRQGHTDQKGSFTMDGQFVTRNVE